MTSLSLLSCLMTLKSVSSQFFCLLFLHWSVNSGLHAYYVTALQLQYKGLYPQAVWMPGMLFLSIGLAKITPEIIVLVKCAFK